jgi:TolB-like protein/DNA-binding winged helix-turn-helix (wHTH) protein/Flp pilus assembly protein TadD
VKPDGRSAEVIRFGVFEADPLAGEVRKHGRRLHLQDQPFRVLCLLLARPGELVTREELRAQVWGADHFVDFEHGLNKAISKLREALGDDRETPLYIETLPRRGYRFIAPTTLGAASAEGSDSHAAPATAAEERVGGSSRRRRRIRGAAILALGLFLSLAAVVWRSLDRGRGTVPAAHAAAVAPIHSLAVLPLQSLSSDPSQEYFTDGMTDELITDLGEMGALRVISRTSAMQYRQTTKSLPQIGRELGADAIVEGTVFSAGGRVRITAQLIDARTDRHLWAHEYERPLRDVLDLQDDVARDIADAVRLELTPQVRARLAVPHPVNPVAHEAYLRGRYYWNQFTEADVRRSRQFFEQTIAADSSYALGYSGLADAYSVMYVRFGGLPRDEACPKAEAAALKAVQLDDSLAEAHHSLGAVRLFCDWDWQSAEDELKRAIHLNPNYAEPRRVYADLLAFRGRSAESLRQAELAIENDPMSADVNQMFGWIYYWAHRYDQAVGQLRVALRMDPNRPAAHAGLFRAYVQLGQLDRALGEARQAVRLTGGAAWALSELGYADALAGKRNEALQSILRLNQLSMQQPVSPFDRILVYIALGDKQRAFAWLEQAFEQHETGMIWLKADPEYDGLRSDPRFQDLMRRVGL